jgi:transposase
MTCAEQFRVMAFAQLTWRESLRDIEVTLGANANKLYAMGLRHTVHRSTLADANDSRDWRIWSDLSAVLIRRARKLYCDEDLGLDLTNTVYALDSTTIDLCLSLFDWAPFRKTKAAIKMHTLLDLRGAIPAFIHISDGKMGDVNVLDFLPVEAGAFYVMDRGYLDFGRLYKLHQAGAFFVTRAKSNMNARRVYSAATDRETGVICDQMIAMNGFYVSQDYPEHLRRIRFKDPVSGKSLIFLTNSTTLPALTIAALYKNRWQVELFFKWIKQHLRIKKFLGTSENAVKTQIWCAVSTYVLIAIVKKELQLNASLYTLLQILSVSVFEKTQISCALQIDPATPELPLGANQLSLFDF